MVPPAAPDLLADRDPDPPPAEAEDLRCQGRRLKVAVFIEYAGGETGLPERLLHRPVPEEGGGVEERPAGAGEVWCGEADEDRRRIPEFGGQVFQDGEAPLHEPLPEKQVPGRAPGQGEFRGHDQVRPVTRCLTDARRYPVGVAGEVSGNRVHLEE